jgi:hypothetical protein
MLGLLVERENRRQEKVLIIEKLAVILTIPREYSGKPLAADPIATVVNGEKVRRVYRE